MKGGSVPGGFSWRLFVVDDCVGLAAVDRYDADSGLGLSLCRRIAARFGGALELAVHPLAARGTTHHDAAMQNTSFVSKRAISSTKTSPATERTS